MLLPLPPGLNSDSPWATPPQQARWATGYNVRFRMGHPETIGLFGALQKISGAELVLPTPTGAPYRSISTSGKPGTVQIVAGSVAAVQVIEADPTSTPQTGTRYLVYDITPTGLPAEDDTIPDPSMGVVHIPHDWFFLVDGSRVFGARADVAEIPYWWDRDLATPFTQLTAAPMYAVGGAVVDGILVLLGAESIDPGTDHRMTVRWSDRYNWEEWTPDLTNTAGEYLLTNGSRIVGGGNSSHGVVVWTDTSMTLLNPVEDIDVVFSRREVSSSHGLLSNKAWVEVEGVLYWLDQHRKLCRYAGGRVDVIANPVRLSTIERVDDAGVARIYLSASVEFGEVLIWYPLAANDDPNRALVYNYRDRAWSVWGLSRPAWHDRVGVTPPIGIAPDGTVYAHDLDVGIPDGNLPTNWGAFDAPAANNVEPFDWELRTSLVTSDRPADRTHGVGRVLVSTLVSHAVGAETDVMGLEVRHYREAKVSDDYTSEAYELRDTDSVQDLRGEGRALQLLLRGRQVKSVTRIGLIDLGAQQHERGER